MKKYKFKSRKGLICPIDALIVLAFISFIAITANFFIGEKEEKNNQTYYNVAGGLITALIALSKADGEESIEEEEEEKTEDWEI